MEPGKVEFRLFSGAVAYVTPLSPDTMLLIRDAQRAVGGDWEKEFEKELDSEIALSGVVGIDQDDPAYIAKRQAVESERQQIFRDMVSDICIEFERPQDQLIIDFAPRIAKMRKYLKLPDDDWKATLYHAVIVRPEEWTEINKVIMHQLPIREEEIRESMRIFRPVLSRSRVLGIDTKPPSIHEQPAQATG